LGIRQAQAVAEGLKEYSIHQIYSSDLGRAQQTSGIICQHLERDYKTDKRLRERNLGLLQGYTKSEFKTAHPQEWEKFTAHQPDYVIPQGESILHRYERSVNFIEELLVSHGDETVLVVCHGGVLMSFMDKALGLPLTQKRRYSLNNGSINCFSVDKDKNWTLESWGDVSPMRRAGLSTMDDN